MRRNLLSRGVERRRLVGVGRNIAHREGRGRRGVARVRVANEHDISGAGLGVRERLLEIDVIRFRGKIPDPFGAVVGREPKP